MGCRTRGDDRVAGSSPAGVSVFFDLLKKETPMKHMPECYEAEIAQLKQKLNTAVRLRRSLSLPTTQPAGTERLRRNIDEFLNHIDSGLENDHE